VVQRGLNDGGHWRAGWYGAPSVLGGLRINKTDYVPCRVAYWRVTLHEPANMKISPEMPADAQWHRLMQTDPN